MKYEKIAEMLKILANPKRLEILNAIKTEEVTVNKLAKILGVYKSNVSQHLSILRMTGIVTARRQGKNVFYRIADKKVVKFLDAVMLI